METVVHVKRSEFIQMDERVMSLIRERTSNHSSLQKCIMSHLGDQFLQQNKRTFIRDLKSAIPQQCMSVCGTTYIFGRESVDKFPNEHFGAAMFWKV